MTARGDGQAPPVSAIVVTFTGPREADCGVAWTDAVTDGQLYAAAWVLDQVAREIRSQVKAGETARQTLAQGDATALLRQLGIDLPAAHPPGAHG